MTSLSNILLSSFELLAARVPSIPKGYNPRNVNPALMTFQEYSSFVNSKNKFHDSSAYQTTLKKFNFDYDGKRSPSSLPERYETLLQRKRINGLIFEFRLHTEVLKYTNREDPANIRDYTADEIKAKGLREHGFTIAVFNPQKLCVGRAQDEWGAMLVWVVEEYKGFGLGPLLIKFARSLEPAKDSGGFTLAGINNLKKFHRELVRDALTQGLYRDWIAKKLITTAKVKEIVKEAGLQTRPNFNTNDFDSNDPKDWLLYSDYEYGSFILYNKKFKDLYNTGDKNHRWAESMIKGAITVYELDKSHAVHCGIVNLFGGDNPKIKTFLLKLAATYCRDHKLPFYVDAVDIQYIPEDEFTIGPVTNKTGLARHLVKIRKPVKNLRYLGIPELKWRKSVDQYDELLNGILETAHAKFRYDNTLEASDRRKDKVTDKLLEADESKPYTNKSKNTKLVYYANRSTAQVCKPGQTVHAKKGYGKRTSIKTATPEQVKQLKAGKWVRTRESGHEPNEPGAKQSKYRPKLAAKSREAKRKKLAASDTPSNRYKAFIEEMFKD